MLAFLCAIMALVILGLVFVAGYALVNDSNQRTTISNLNNRVNQLDTRVDQLDSQVIQLDNRVRLLEQSK
jgi:outer membrane murein-binding lipoprotein Lpp